MTTPVALLERFRLPAALVAAFAAGAVLILLAGRDPIEAYAALFHEAFLDFWGLSNTLVKAGPIILAALAVVFPYRAGLYNIGGEGQIYIGGLAATLAALSMPPWLPSALAIPCVLVCAMLGGAAWAGLAGLLKAYRGVNEVISTLLMNFVAIHIVSYAVSGPMLAAGAPYPYSEEIRPSLHLPILLAESDAHIGVALAIVLAMLLHVYFKGSAHGHALDIVGRNAEAARYAGIAVERQMVRALAVGGALAGLAGGLEILGVKHRLFHLFSGGYGFDGIVVAFIASAQPIFVPAAGLLIAGLKAGAGGMQRLVGVDATIVDALRGLIVMFVAAGLAWRPQQPSIRKSWRSPAPGRPQAQTPETLDP